MREKRSFARAARQVSQLFVRKSALKSMIYNDVGANMPAWARSTVTKLMGKGFLKGDETGELHLDDQMLRMLAVLDRAGVFGM